MKWGNILFLTAVAVLKRPAVKYMYTRLYLIMADLRPSASFMLRSGLQST